MRINRSAPACLALVSALAACDASSERPTVTPEPRLGTVAAAMRAQPALDPGAREYCHARVRGAHRGARIAILDSVEVTVRGRDTVLVAGAAERTGSDGERRRHGWTCDLIREADGRWRQWHFGLEPVERVAGGR